MGKPTIIPSECEEVGRSLTVLLADLMAYGFGELTITVRDHQVASVVTSQVYRRQDLPKGEAVRLTKAGARL